MITGIIGDIHGNYRALQAVIEDMRKTGVEKVIVLGDLVFGGDEPQACFDAVRALEPLAWIRGNTDDWFNEIGTDFTPADEKEERIFREFLQVKSLLSAEAADVIAALPEKAEIRIGGKRILCVHGSDRRINEPIGIMTPPAELEGLFARLTQHILLCAHTHQPFIAALNGKLVVNVGSVGAPQDEHGASYGLLDFGGGGFTYAVRRVPAPK